jgi:hypothetical protein
MSIIYFCLFYLLAAMQDRRLRRDPLVKVEQPNLAIALGISNKVGSIVWIAYMIIYSVKVAWWAGFALAGISLLATLIFGFIIRITGDLIWSYIGFCWPVLAYLAFSTMPK